MIVTVLGRRWRLRFAPNLANRGDCDAPTTPSKEIRVSSDLDAEERLEVILHELLHASCWPLAEEFVEQFAADAARVLRRLGYHH